MKTHFAVLLLVVSLGLAACASVAATPTPTPQPTLAPTDTPFPTQKLRITNQSTTAINNLVVRFPETRVEFGDVLPGATTDYRDVPLGVYRYAAYSVDVAGQNYQQPVIDWVGEVPMPGTAFTYILDVDPAKWTTEGAVIFLTQTVTDQ